MKKILFVFFVSVGVFIISCTKAPQYSSAQYGSTAVKKMSNEWWVNISLPGLGNLTPTPTFFQTYNTASNTADSMWLDDLGNGYGFKCTTAVNYPALTFGVKNSLNNYVDGNGDSSTLVTVLNGKVLPKSGHSRAGNVTDSIYMQVIFSDDATDTFTIAGTARTGFDEDDY
jgi:lipid-binding putative hydrolase